MGKVCPPDRTLLEGAPNFLHVPTTEEAMGHKWHKGVWRGFAGLPKEIVAHEAAIKKAWDGDEFKEFMNRRGSDMIYLDSADDDEFMKADNADNGAALKSLGLANQGRIGPPESA